METWEDFNLLAVSCLKGKLPPTDTIYEVIAGLRPTAMDSLWGALELALNIPLRESGPGHVRFRCNLL